MGAIFNAIFSSVLFLACAITLILMYKWALRPVFDYYNISIPLRDISAYLQQQQEQGAISLSGPDEFPSTSYDSPSAQQISPRLLESGIGISPLTRPDVVETPTQPSSEDPAKPPFTLTTPAVADDDASDIFFDTHSTIGSIQSLPTGSFIPRSNSISSTNNTSASTSTSSAAPTSISSLFSPPPQPAMSQNQSQSQNQVAYAVTARMPMQPSLLESSEES